MAFKVVKSIGRPESVIKHTSLLLLSFIVLPGDGGSRSLGSGRQLRPSVTLFTGW